MIMLRLKWAALYPINSVCRSSIAGSRFFPGPASHQLSSHLSAPSLCQACRPGDHEVWCIWTQGHSLASRTHKPCPHCGNCLSPLQAEWRWTESAERVSLKGELIPQGCPDRPAGKSGCVWILDHSRSPQMKHDPSTIYLLRKTSGSASSPAFDAPKLVGPNW